MITRTFSVNVRPEKRREFLQAVRPLVEDREKEDGLRNSFLYREHGESTGFRLVFEWETQESMERYLGGEKFQVLLGALEMLCETSEISAY